MKRPGSLMSWSSRIFLCVVLFSAACFGQNGYSYSRPILIDHTRVANTDQTDFPVLISGTFAYLATIPNGGQVQSASGYDIVFTSDGAGQTGLDHEIDSYDPSTGTVSFWVRIPLLSHTADTTLYIWYGNSAVTTSQENKTGVWRNGYASVYHFGSQTALALGDSGSANYTLAGSAFAAAGKIGGGASFSTYYGTSLTHNSVPNYPSGSSPVTLEAWAKVASGASGELVGYGENTVSGDRIGLSVDTNLALEAQSVLIYSPWATSSNWHHLVGVYGGGQLSPATSQLFIDGVQLTTTPYYPATLGILTTQLKLGGIPTVGFCCTYDGALDEVRISSVARSADWVATEYNNQNSPSTFATIGGPAYLVIQPSSLPAAIQYLAYSVNLITSGGVAPYTWSIASGALPAGLSLDPSAGVISGTAATVGTSTFTVRSVDANLNSASRTMSLIVYPPRVALTDIDIGSVPSPGSSSYNDGIYTVTSTGADSRGTADSLHFLYQSWSGDFDVMVHVASQQLTNNIPKAGIMVRETLDPGASNVFAWVSPNFGAGIQWRLSSGATEADPGFSASGKAPYWVRLIRRGNVFAGLGSYDGQNWYAMGSQTVVMASNVYVGIAQTTDYAPSNVSTYDSYIANSSPLPGPWLDQDVGAPVAPGAAIFDGSAFFIHTSGQDVSSASDPGENFIYQPWTGDLDIKVRVRSQQNTAQWAKIGLMVRESLDANAANVFNFLTPASGSQMQWRASTGATETGLPGILNAPEPSWIRLIRSGSTFSSYWSPDGSTWTLVGATEVNLASSVMVGVAATNYYTAWAADVVDNLQITTPTSSGVQPPWSRQDVGSVAAPGGSTADGVSTLLWASSGDIGNNADSFQFMSQPWTGDVDLIARVTSVQNTNTSAKAGVMIRETLDAGSREAMAYVTPGSGVNSQARTTPGGATSFMANLPGPVAPYWVRLTRRGNLFTAYASIDGSNWVPMGSQVISMASSVYVGLALSSYSSTLNTSSFDHAGAVAPTTSPSVSITSPADGTMVHSHDFSITATAATTSGAVTKVEFFNGQTKVGEADSAPYTVNVTGVPQGTWPFTAQVTDSNGEIALSAPVNITINLLPNSFLQTDIGTYASPGNTTYNAGSWTVFSQNSDICCTSDSLHFTYKFWTGDVDAIARIASMPLTTTLVKAGVMVRESLDPGASEVSAMLMASGVTAIVRSGSNANTVNIGGAYSACQGAPCWVRIIRRGDVFTVYAATDGVNWTPLGSQTVPMATSVYVGLANATWSASYSNTSVYDNFSVVAPPSSPAVAITSPSDGAVIRSSAFSLSATASTTPGSITRVEFFDNVTKVGEAGSAPYTVNVAGVPIGTHVYTAQATDSNGTLGNSAPVSVTVTSLPDPWLQTDISPNSTTPLGTYSSGVFTLQALGSDIWSYTDSFHYAYQPWNGDADITVRVASLQCVNSWAKAGVMIRESLDPTAREVMAYVTPGNGVNSQVRTDTRGETAFMTSLPGFVAPYWVRLTRRGNVFNAYGSADASSWVWLGSQTVSMASNVYVGLAVSSFTPYLATATFDNLSLVASAPLPLVIQTNSVAGSTTNVAYSATVVASGGQTPYTWSIAAGALPAGLTLDAAAGIISGTPTTTGPSTFTVKVQDAAGTAVTQNLGISIYHADSLTPPAGAIGGNVTISGSGFGASQGNGQVIFNGLAAYVSSWSDTSITVTVAGGTTSGPVTVNAYGATGNPLPFTVEGQPAITGVSPQGGYVSTQITLTGSGFGATQSNSTITFGDVPAVPISWSDTQIVVAVPPNADFGPITVTVAGFSGSSTIFSLYTVTALTDSLAHQSYYTASVSGGKTRVYSSDGPGCSSCTMRGPSQETYDAVGNQLTATDALGHVTSYSYDAQGNELTASRPLDSTTTATTSYTYNNLGEVLTSTDPLGNVTTNTYDANGNLLSVTSPAPDANTPPSVTRFTYDTKGELLTITDPLSHVTTMTYTPEGYIHAITDANQKVTTYEYDSRGNRTAVVDALQNRTTFAYDAMNRLTSITYPDSTSVAFGYDSRGRRTSATDQDQRVTTYAYDDADRLISVTDAATHLTQYAYDSENNLTSITDAANHTTAFAYDAKGRVTQTTFPSALSESYAYDLGDHLTSKTDRKGQTIVYVYDALDRLAHKVYSDSTSVDYIYDLVGKIRQVTDPTGTYGFAYDNMGRLLGTTTQYSFLSGQTFSNSYAYDAASNRTGFTAPDGSTNAYAYDTLNRLSTLTNSVAGQFGFGYDDLSRRTSLTRPNGVNTSYSYDNLSRLLSVLHQTGAATVDGAAYTYDNAGNRLTRTNYLNNAVDSYTYDPIYQLTQVQEAVNGQAAATTESYSYDNVGNRLSSLNIAQYNYDSSNHLNSSSDGVTYTYDNNGNTITKTDSTGVTGYNWDFENRLTSVQLPGGNTVTFKYDPFGRRIQKSSSAGMTNFLYDGAGIIAEMDSTGTTTAKYAQGTGIDEPLSMSRNGVTDFYNADGLGSVTSLFDATSTAAATYSYSSFGSASATGGAVTNPFQYTGREWDGEIGLYYYRARFYSSAIGRFLSEDLMGFAGDGTDFYLYVENNPLIKDDPTGLAECTYSISSGHLHCTPEKPGHAAVDIIVASGNNGGGLQCKNNPKCTKIKDRGPIPQGPWQWTDGDTNAPNGRVLTPLFDTDRASIRSHSCLNPFGPSLGPKFCSKGCITGFPRDMNKLNELIDAEPGSTLQVTD